MRKSMVRASIAALMLATVALALWLAGPAVPVAQVDEQLRTMREQIEPLRRAGSEGRAKDLAAQAVELARSRYGADHIEVARSLEALAQFNWHLKDLPDDMKPSRLQSVAIAIKRKVLGNTHLEVAKSIEELANFHYLDDEDELAEKFASEALKIREKLLGSSHPDLAHALTILGNARGDRVALERAVELREKALGAAHLDTAVSYLHLGVHAYKHSQPDAEALLQRALTGLEGAVLRSDPLLKHPNDINGHALVAVTMLEAIFRDAGRQSELAAIKDRFDKLGKLTPKR